MCSATCLQDSHLIKSSGKTRGNTDSSFFDRLRSYSVSRHKSEKNETPAVHRLAYDCEMKTPSSIFAADLHLTAFQSSARLPISTEPFTGGGRPTQASWLLALRLDPHAGGTSFPPSLITTYYLKTALHETQSALVSDCDRPVLNGNCCLPYGRQRRRR